MLSGFWDLSGRGPFSSRPSAQRIQRKGASASRELFHFSRRKTLPWVEKLYSNLSGSQSRAGGGRGGELVNVALHCHNSTIQNPLCYTRQNWLALCNSTNTDKNALLTDEKLVALYLPQVLWIQKVQMSKLNWKRYPPPPLLSIISFEVGAWLGACLLQTLRNSRSNKNKTELPIWFFVPKRNNELKIDYSWWKMAAKKVPPKRWGHWGLR